MRQMFFVALFFAFFLLLGCLQQGEQKPLPVLEKATVEKVVDGDTVLLENSERVRLIGIDTPEKGEKCSEEAKNRLQQLVLGKQVLLLKDISERDKYGRLVRYVYADGTFVNIAMVEEGFAKAFEFEPDTSLKQLFREAEKKAIAGKKCLWAE